MSRTVNAKLSVRELVEFLLRSGDIDNRFGQRDPDAMQEGVRLHKKIQKRQPGFYRAECPLSLSTELAYEGDSVTVTVEGRADGIMRFSEDSDRSLLENEALAFSDVPVVVDEIKCVLRDLVKITEPVPVHLAQAKVYAAILATAEDLPSVGVQLSYCHIESERIKYFTEIFEREELLSWYRDLLLEYCKWLHWQNVHTERRNASIKELTFPFPYRPGQFDLCGSVYRTINRGKRLFIEAPTGVGKTISVVFPAVKAMGEGLLEKVFYLTAKTITRTVAEDTFRLLLDSGLSFLPITITAKEKVCVLEKPECNPVACSRAHGHFDRINEAVFSLLTELERRQNDPECSCTEDRILTRELLLEYAERYEVCPYEMSLDAALFMDAVICDYNYVFDPVVYFRRFFGAEKKDYAFLVDEAHNLVSRARDMYSVSIVKEDLLAAKRVLKDLPRTAAVVRSLDAANRKMLEEKRSTDGLMVLPDADLLNDCFDRILGSFDLYTQSTKSPLPDDVTDLYFSLRLWAALTEIADDHFLYYKNHDEDGHFYVRLQCMDPSEPLRDCTDKGRAAVFFSATLLPINYYKSQLSGELADYAVYAESSFPPENRKILIAGDVDTRYKSRNEETYRKIAEYIRTLCLGKEGNYMVFFPSYKMLSEVQPYLSGLPFTFLSQKPNMTEQEKEAFLDAFTEEHGTLVGLCVMGGIFSEGIDLRNDRLIGAVIVGPGLPQVGAESELFRDYFEENSRAGFEYAYLYPGMNKVLQSAGRVIRTTTDRGVILLLDARFRKARYTDLFPKEWWPNVSVTLDTLPAELAEFWSDFS